MLNSPPDKFLIPVYKIHLYVTLPPSGLYRLKINHMPTQETGLDWISFSTSYEEGWFECTLNMPDKENI